MPEEKETPGGSETPSATDGLGSQAAPPSEETPTPAPEKAPESETPPKDAAPSESETPAPEKTEPPAWSSFTTADEVLAHEDFSVALKDKEESGYKRGKDENQRVQGQLHAQQNQAKSLETKVEAFNTSWLSVMEAAKLDTNGIDMQQLLALRTEHKDMFESLSNYKQEMGRWEGIENFVAGVADALDSEEFKAEFDNRISQVKTGAVTEDTAFYKDLMSAAAKVKIKPLEDELVEAKAKIGRLEGEMKTLARQGEDPPPETASGGSSNGQGPDAVLRSKSATPAEKEAAFKEKHGLDIREAMPTH